MSEKLKLGIIGLGNMGGSHMKSYADGNLPEIEITAVADIDEKKFARALELIPGVKCFNSATELIQSGLCQAVLIATPHYFHPTIGIEAMEAGLHVMSEKPAGVYTKQVRELIACADKHPDLTYAIMFNQRTNCTYRTVKRLIASGKYGEIKRVSWIMTDWFRTQAYYNSGGWRATWSGEGGGVMLNQCPHQLDLWQWLCGMPSKVRAVCHVGKWHNIEVEDDVTIYVEYPNGATGTFITSTGDFPGTNRLEITMEKAQIVINNDRSANGIRIFEMDQSSTEFSNTSSEGFGKMAGEWKDLPTDDNLNLQHVGVLNAFAAHILRGEPLIADGREGINGLTISNAAFLSSWTDKEVTLPIDEKKFYKLLQKKIKGSTYKKTVVEQVKKDMSGTY